jgi:5-methyltetrahydropteroyltriglutamate--homocysteine methyltransferase
MLKWSFVREDQPLRTTALQMGWALRDEISDLEREGLFIIQVDEPALREGLPLRKSARPDYLRTAVDAFRLATGGAAPSTQIHTHMCYAEFQDVKQDIISLDADVISIESARSRTELLEALGQTSYPNEIGPGVFDIHSPRVPDVEEMAERLRTAGRFVPATRLWVNPDCGLKTRNWPEVTESLRRMVQAAKLVRSELAG